MNPLSEKYSYQTVYQFSSNQPIHAQELEGLESAVDLNSRDPGLSKLNISSKELKTSNRNAGTAAAVGAFVGADIHFTKGKVLKNLTTQTAIQLTFIEVSR